MSAHPPAREDPVMKSDPLNADEIEHFHRYGYVCVRGAFDAGPGSRARALVERTWVRSGIDPNAPDTWPPKVHMPPRDVFPVRTFAPRAYDAICQLTGGPDRIEDPVWSDGLIVNYSLGANGPYLTPDATKKGWHKDGNFFIHFLDSPEQALLTVVLWDDVVSRGGPTYLAADSVPRVAEVLADHPEGLGPGDFPVDDMIARCRDFREATGRGGDVYLLHPYMLHCSSQNMLRRPRFMSNPPVHFRAPMRFDREPLSPVEASVVRAVGDRARTFRIRGERRHLHTQLQDSFERMKREEDARLAAAAGETSA